ncbi:MAG: hypothetical protein EBZ77_07550 [Chitinophagia bacterium]|nr:hypothetical protein [Chitinophagia bacterium]
MKKRLGLIIVTFILSLLLMGALSLSSVKRLTTYISYSNQMDRANMVLMRMYDVEKDMRDIDRTERGYMLMHDTLFIRLINLSVSNVRTHLDSLEWETRDDEEIQKKIRLIRANTALRIDALHRNLYFADTSVVIHRPVNYHETRSIMTEIAYLLRDMHNKQVKLRAERWREEQFYESITTPSITWLLVVFCAATCLLFGLLIREFIARNHYQDELQAKIADLSRSHTELEEIAYVASHDLQEPLRKIQVFCNMLQYKNADISSPVYADNLRRISAAANRMQALITDLMKLTSLTKTGQVPEVCDLNRMLYFVVQDLDEELTATGGKIDLKLLPDTNGYPDQLRILFREILQNALKFRHSERAPEIVVSCTTVSGDELSEVNSNLRHKKFFRIEVTDNGIGFDSQFTAKMFQIFQRLHHNESGYDGKGIGLAICQRIMANHDGYILAEGKPGVGATFKLFFPTEG